MLLCSKLVAPLRPIASILWFIVSVENPAASQDMSLHYHGNADSLGAAAKMLRLSSSVECKILDITPRISRLKGLKKHRSIASSWTTFFSPLPISSRLYRISRSFLDPTESF